MTTEFLEQLQYDIERQKTINSNPMLYIQQKNITPYKFSRKLSQIDKTNLPIQTTIGTCYLIKNNDIIKIYSWYDPARSMYIQVNIKKLMWLSKLYVVNRDGMRSLLTDIDNQTIHDPEYLEDCILHLIHSGFILHI
jgi:hypothetical protein